MKTDAPPTASAAALPWQQFICHACGYIYDEAEGDPDSGLPPGTRYADIPDDWACPLCGVTKADFSPYTPPRPASARACATAATPARPGQNAGVVIVGAGHAGWQLAAALRAADAGLPITLVTACAGDVYDKPQLSVAMARGLDARALVRETGADAAQRLGVHLLAHTQAVRICAATRQLRTTRGTLRYGRLVLAHGAQPALPSALPPALVWRINHLAAYQRLREALGDATTTGPREVLIIGAGLVGSELANDLALGGHRITLMDLQTRPLARWPAVQAGVPLLEAWRDLPIEFVGGEEVTAIEKKQGRLRITTGSGRRLVADQVIAATGLVTPPRLARSAGLAWQSGICVDRARLLTSDAHVHALGDCASVDGQASRFIEPIARQVSAIVAHITGGPARPYEVRQSPVRVKTTSRPLTLAA